MPEEQEPVETLCSAPHTITFRSGDLLVGGETLHIDGEKPPFLVQHLTMDFDSTQPTIATFHVAAINGDIIANVDADQIRLRLGDRLYTLRPFEESDDEPSTEIPELEEDSEGSVG